ncbi:MAG: hypothetical protein ABIZ64_03385 [Casimicrobium sp.]|jgi:hypothetical protein
MLASTLIAASAAITGLLGCVHLLFTFNGPKLHPRDPNVMRAMANTCPVITKETTVWRATVGFNASHSMGLMLFGIIYPYLALAQPTMFWQSPLLITLGLVVLLAYLTLAKLYWFSVPFRGVTLATTLYVAGLIVHAL